MFERLGRPLDDGRQKKRHAPDSPAALDVQAVGVDGIEDIGHAAKIDNAPSDAAGQMNLPRSRRLA